MLGNMSNEYISLNVPTIPLEFNPKRVWTRKTIVRWWNQLSRFQRSLSYMLILIILLAILYLRANSTAPAVAAAAFLAGKDPGDLDQGGSTIQTTTSISKSTRDVHNQENIQQVKLVDTNVQKPNENNNEINPNNNEVNQIQLPINLEFPNEHNEKQEAIVSAVKHAWKGYKKYAWGHDHLKPISGGYHDWYTLGLTIVDSLDTLFIMGLKEEFQEARDWVANHLDFNINKDVNLFEVTIRVLGGLLSAYHLSNDRMFLTKALDLGERLLPCFETESGVPFSDVNLATRKAHAPKWSPDSSTSEVTTIQLEFRDLSRSTGDPRFENVVARVSEHVHNLEKIQGLVPIFINANTGKFRYYSTITFGARGDSYYEYLLKQWIQTGKTIDYLKNDYVEAIGGAMKLLVKKTSFHNYLFIGEIIPGGKDFKPKMDHLTCYLPGTLALGVHNGLPSTHMDLARDLLETCYQTYAQQPTFLAPEITYFNIQESATSDFYVKTSDAHNLLRPEFVESLWYMFHLSGNQTYQDMGWKIFESFEKYTKVTNGYTSISNVRNPINTRPKDMMESFFLGETLKYLFLLFNDERNLLDLDKYVFNSEAHPLPIYST